MKKHFWTSFKPKHDFVFLFLIKNKNFICRSSSSIHLKRQQKGKPLSTQEKPSPITSHNTKLWILWIGNFKQVAFKQNNLWILKMLFKQGKEMIALLLNWLEKMIVNCFCTFWSIKRLSPKTSPVSLPTWPLRLPIIN